MPDVPAPREPHNVRLLKLALLQIAILSIASGCDSTPEGASLAGEVRIGKELRFVPRSPGDKRAYVTNPRDGTLLILDPDTAIPGLPAALPRRELMVLAPENPDG